MRNAVAFANNDVVTIAWSYGKRPDGCMGFALYRIDSKGKQTVLPSHAVFKGDAIKAGQTTEEFPIQKFYWKDPYARLAGEKSGDFHFRYKIVPFEGAPGHLEPMSSLPFLTTNEVELTSRCSPSLSAVFNRGLISTQHVAKELKGNLGLPGFLKRINSPGDQLRKDLTGQAAGTLTGFLTRAVKSGQIHAALYELTDVELIKSLVALGTKLNIVLADIVTKEKLPKKEAAAKKGAKRSASKKTAGTIEENKGAFDDIGNSTGNGSLLYRQPPSGHIVHNKFLIYVDAKGRAQAVLTGSTNWTATGLCAQTNNVLVIEDPFVAQRYMDYWNELKADQVAHQQDNKSFQAPALRSFNSEGKPFKLDKTVPKGDPTTPSDLTSYFSPNTLKQRSKKKGEREPEPIDMKDLEGRVKVANHAVLFLAFIPGTPSITDFASKAQLAKKDLFVRGCVTSPDAAGEFYYTLHGSSPPKKTRAVKGQPKPPKVPVKQDPRVIAAQALDKADAPKGWVAELLKAGFAITHDKIVVIDPFADDCVVVTGSHNLGYQASYNNDENLVMIRGNKKLAAAYATHVLDVYDHFAWRWTLKKGTPHDDSYVKSDSSYLQSTADEWLDRYFDSKGNIKTAQLKFWMQATV
jgi:phosphatidylserine/phosphatidylglycerophosphate/cardiolipin synthase-like enzyme